MAQVCFANALLPRRSKRALSACATSPRAPPRARTANAGVSGSARRYKALSWAHVERMCKHLAHQARNQRFDVILAVTRGGLVPAVMLCEAFELRNIVCTTVMFYTDGGEQFFGMTEPRFLSFPSADALQGRRVLIVDDVWDSGRTAQAVRSRVKRADAKDVKVAVLHYKPHSNVFAGMQPDFYSALTAEWIVYPWETLSPNAPQVAVELDDASLPAQPVDHSPQQLNT